MESPDAYFKKTIRYIYRGYKLQFWVSQELFSSYNIDIGTQRLLRTLSAEKFNAFNKILDLGCGYGPIGIALKAVCQSSVVHLVDRDALALDYSRQNTKLNNLSNIKIYASLGYDEVAETDFDLIVSNIPAKVGEPVLSHLLQEAKFYLREGGQIAIVAIEAIARQVAKILTDPNINILFHQVWPGHVVYHYEFSSGTSFIPKPKHSAFDRGVYIRGKKSFSLGPLSFSLQTAYGLPEFDTLSYETELLLDGLCLLPDQLKKAVIFNPGQGFIPVALSQTKRVGEIILADRDLLALRISQKNLELNGYPTKKVFLFHQVGLYQKHSGSSDCIIGTLGEKDGLPVHKMFVQQAASQLAPNGSVILASSSTAITRIETFVRSRKLLDVWKRRRDKGKSLIILKHK